jgi:hypothetical protein
MERLSQLYQQVDPLRPLEADEIDLYVDWQKQLGADDVKRRLANSIALSGPVAVTRLFTGHRGVGKTTELKRVQRLLAGPKNPRKLFVSFLFAEEWVDLNDVSPPDLVFQMVRQLVSDLRQAGFTFGWTKFGEFFREFWEVLQSEVELKDLKISADPLEFSIVLKNVPGARGTLRKLLADRLPTIYDLVNGTILKKAREWLRDPAHGEYQDILVIVDQLDRIPQKQVFSDRDLTNHEHIFLDNAGTLRALNCDVLYTIPIELAYSRCRGRLRDTYGSDILALPMVRVRDQAGKPCPQAVQALRDMVQRRAQKAGVTETEFFSDPQSLEWLILLCGGHVRSLFILLRSSIERAGRIPIPAAVLEQTVIRGANDFVIGLGGLGAEGWAALEEVHRSKQALADSKRLDLWNSLLRDLYAFTYEDEKEDWYDWNPLLGEVKRRPAS